jgi:hypothetical protein
MEGLAASGDGSRVAEPGDCHGDEARRWGGISELARLVIAPYSEVSNIGNTRMLEE